jgi:hypothetical protein
MFQEELCSIELQNYVKDISTYQAWLKFLFSRRLPQPGGLLPVLLCYVATENTPSRCLAMLWTNPSQYRQQGRSTGGYLSQNSCLAEQTPKDTEVSIRVPNRIQTQSPSDWAALECTATIIKILTLCQCLFMSQKLNVEIMVSLSYPSQHNSKPTLHRLPKWHFDNCCVVTDNEGKYKETQQDTLLEGWNYVSKMQIFLEMAYTSEEPFFMSLQSEAQHSVWDTNNEKKSLQI